MRIQTNDLREALNKASIIINGKIHLPILACVTFAKHYPEQVTLNATDLETHLQVELTCDNPLDVCIPLKPLLEFVKSLDKKSEVEITEVVNNKALVASGFTSITIDTMSIEDYPCGVSSPETTLIGSGSVANLFSAFSGLYASSTDDSRFNLNTALVDVTTGTIVCTDGHRLSIRPTSIFHFLKTNILIGRKQVEHLLKTFKKSDMFTIESFTSGAPRYIKFSDGVTSSTIRLIDGDYPTYQNVLPKNTREQISMDRKTLLSFIKPIKVTEYEKAIHFNTNCNSIEIKFDNKMGQITEGKLPGNFSDEYSVILSKNYLVDLIEHADNFRLEQEKEGGPCVIHSNHGLDMLMPMRK